MFVTGKADHFHNAVQNLTVVHADHIVTARNAEAFHCVRSHHADFCVCRDGRRTNGISIKLHELTETARYRLLVAEYVSSTIAAVRLWQAFEIFRHMTGEGRGQVIPQAHPLLVIIL